MDKKWNPTIDQVNGPISRTWDFISDEATELMEELQCPPEFLADMLKSIASKFEEGGSATTEWNEKVKKGEYRHYY